LVGNSFSEFNRAALYKNVIQRKSGAIRRFDRKLTADHVSW
jgi:hypothetical protein